MINKALYIKEDVNSKKAIFGGVVQKIENDLVYIYDNSNPRGYRNHVYNLNDIKKWIAMGLMKFKMPSYNQTEDKGE